MDLGNNSIIEIYPQFIPKNKTNQIFNNLMKNVNWCQAEFNMCGKITHPDRLLSAIHNKGDNLGFSCFKSEKEQTWEMFPEIKEMKENIEKITKKEIRYVFMNFYENGNNHINYHSDRRLQQGQIVGSISLGASRKFRFKPTQMNKECKDLQYELNLDDGILLLFDCNAGSTQWKHSVPKELKILQPRINLTFRQ